MGRVFLFLALSCAVNAKADHLPGPIAFDRLSQDTVAATWQKLKECQLLRLSAQDPRLPPPSIPAHEAVVNQSGRLLAYSYQPGYYGYEFKNPNGSFVHAVYFNNHRIQFQTPYAGTVALANRVNYGGTWKEQYFCRGYSTDLTGFQECIRTQFIDLIASQLCRFAG